MTIAEDLEKVRELIKKYRYTGTGQFSAKQLLKLELQALSIEQDFFNAASAARQLALDLEYLL
jgi:hypothetical protein